MTQAAGFQSLIEKFEKMGGGLHYCRFLRYLNRFGNWICEVWRSVTFGDLNFFLEGQRRMGILVVTNFCLDSLAETCSKEPMNAAGHGSSGLYPWSKDLEGSRDVSLREKPGFAMLLGWMDKFVSANDMVPGREACARFWRESVMSRQREAWQVEQWSRKRLRLTRWVS